MSVTNRQKLDCNQARIPAARAVVNAARQRVNTVTNADLHATVKAKNSARGALDTAQEVLSGYEGNIEHYREQIQLLILIPPTTCANFITGCKSNLAYQQRARHSSCGG
jgi:hypothetical protein